MQHSFDVFVNMALPDTFLSGLPGSRSIWATPYMMSDSGVNMNHWENELLIGLAGARSQRRSQVFSTRRKTVADSKNRVVEHRTSPQHILLRPSATSRRRGVRRP